MSLRFRGSQNPLKCQALNPKVPSVRAPSARAAWSEATGYIRQTPPEPGSCIRVLGVLWVLGLLRFLGFRASISAQACAMNVELCCTERNPEASASCPPALPPTVPSRQMSANLLPIATSVTNSSSLVFCGTTMAFGQAQALNWRFQASSKVRNVKARQQCRESSRPAKPSILHQAGNCIPVAALMLNNITTVEKFLPCQLEPGKTTGGSRAALAFQSQMPKNVANIRAEHFHVDN